VRNRNGFILISSLVLTFGLALSAVDVCAVSVAPLWMLLSHSKDEPIGDVEHARIDARFTAFALIVDGKVRRRQ
jgi:hypothetical protein